MPDCPPSGCGPGREATSQHSEKSYEMIVNLDVVDVYSLLAEKHENTPKNAKKTTT